MIWPCREEKREREKRKRKREREKREKKKREDQDKERSHICTYGGGALWRDSSFSSFPKRSERVRFLRIFDMIAIASKTGDLDVSNVLSCQSGSEMQIKTP